MSYGIPIPLLLNHDASKPIGQFEYDRGGFLVLSFLQGHELTRAQLFAVLGDCGVKILDVRSVGGVEVVTRAQILEWSVSPARAVPG